MPADSKSSNGLTYAESGVNIDVGNALVDKIKPLASSTARTGADADLGGFGGLFDIKAAGFRDPILVAANDGVGTKLKIAIETGIHDTVGIDLVAMCVNDLIVQGAEPLFFLDYLATGSLELETATDIVKGIAQGCKLAGAALIGGETAEMPGLYHNKDYDLAGFTVGAVERENILPKTKSLEAGDVIIAVASSGVHSNGFSLIRKIKENKQLSWDDKAEFSPEQSLGQSLLTPTRIYVKPLLAALKKGLNIKAMAHVTGGGLTENIPRVLPDTLCASIDLSRIEVPGVFDWIRQSAQLPESEMLKTFNCGVGMALIVGSQSADEVLSCLNSYDEKAYVVGELISCTESRVHYTGELNYSGPNS